MIAVGIIFAVLVFFAVLMYNRLVSKKNQVDNAYASIEALLKKRFDLVPNLVESVKGYMKHEADLLTRLTELRTKALSGYLNEEKVMALDGEFRGMATKLLAAVENYPDLKANTNFLQLQAALNEVEEQISAARRAYNAAVKDYNTALETIPTNIIAGIVGYKPRNFFEVRDTEREPVDVGKLFTS